MGTQSRAESQPGRVPSRIPPARFGGEVQAPRAASAQGSAVNFLLDTNVISEPMKARPNRGVLAWLAEVDEDSVFLSVVTVTELRYGVERLPTGRCRARLEGWLRTELPSRFGGRILPVDLQIAGA